MMFNPEFSIKKIREEVARETREKTTKENAIEFAKKLFGNKIPIKDISYYTGLDEDTIKQLSLDDSRNN